MAWCKQDGQWVHRDSLQIQHQTVLPTWMYLVTLEGKRIVETVTPVKCNLCGTEAKSACICTKCQEGLCVICALSYKWIQGSPKQRCCTEHDIVSTLQQLKGILQPLLGCDKREFSGTCRGIRTEYAGGMAVCCVSGIHSPPQGCECRKLHGDVVLLLQASTLLHGFVAEFQRVPLLRDDNRWKYDRRIYGDADLFADLVSDTWLLEDGAAIYPECGILKLQRCHDRYDRWIAISTAFDKLKEQYRSTGYSDKTKIAVLAAISYGVAGVTMDLYCMLSYIAKRMWNIRVAEETRVQSNLLLHDYPFSIHDSDSEDLGST